MGPPPPRRAPMAPITGRTATAPTTTVTGRSSAMDGDTGAGDGAGRRRASIDRGHAGS
jgi:hypothetical protein